MSTAEELRTAAARLRDTKHHGTIVGDCNPELTQLIAALLNAREPLAAWLEGVSASYPVLLAAIANGTYDEPRSGELGYALAIARQILTPPTPTPASPASVTPPSPLA